jgi:hypothetical protein
MRILPNLRASVARETYASLCAILPPPVIDTAEARASRDDAAMQAVAVLRPADAFEARLAVDVVAADAHAKDCLRLASQFFNDFTAALRCRAQFALMMRQMQSALRTLQRMQAARQKDHAAPAPSEDQRTQPKSPRLDESQAMRDPAVPDPAPQPDPLTEAEDYAVLYPLFAARIRASGGLPARLDFTPPDPAIVEALVNGTSLMLCALDQIGREMAQAV